MSVQPASGSPSLKTELIVNQPLLEAQIDCLAAQKDAWQRVTLPQRITFLEQCRAGVLRVAPQWVVAACQAKGLDPHSPLAGEEWLAGPMTVLRHLRLYQEALQAQGHPHPSRVYPRPNGQLVARVFPDRWMERLLWAGFEAEVWIQPGQPASQGAIYRQPPEQGRLALVLGAGNIASIAPLDALYKLFVEDQVVLLKLNPVNAYLRPFLEIAFQPLVEAHFLGFIDGDSRVGSHLCHHPQVDTIHLTGSHHTHDAIVWGSSLEEQTRRKTSDQPQLDKPITAELGCVTPVLVVPGPWSQRDLRFQARQVASMVAHNASFNCTAAKVVITAKGWPQRQAFLTALRQELARIPRRSAYYPGAQERHQAFLAQYPQAESLGEPLPGTLPWTLIPEVPAVAGEYALTQEAFCSVLAEVSLEAEAAPDFLAQAVPFVNEWVWGTLSCTLLLHPAIQKRCAAELDGAIAQLRYGAIGINAWTGVTYSLAVTPWGAFPGQSLQDIGSGVGVVHNTYLFDRPQKSVLWAPFHIFPTPVWFAGHRNLRQLGQRLTAFEAHPTWGKLPGLLLAALRG
jgi:hypothetical protein